MIQVRSPPVFRRILHLDHGPTLRYVHQFTVPIESRRVILRMVSFRAGAARVRDPSRPLADRAAALSGCVSRYHPLGYRATMAYLRDAVGAVEGRWTEEQLMQALELLEESRSSWLVARADWDDRRRREKSEGHRRVPTGSAQPTPWPREPIKPPMVDPSEAIQERFPFRAAQREDYAIVEATLPPQTWPSSSPFLVRVYDDQLAIPGRIYRPEVPSAALSTLTPVQQTMVHCLYTRHHDGCVRQRHLEHVLLCEEPWIAPYVVKLIGEYVVEILFTIRAGLNDLGRPGSRQRRQYGRFIDDNRDFFETTRQRVESYWSCYYRASFTKPARRRSHVAARNADSELYPGFELIDALQDASDDVR